jgi:hypothetical protein
MIRSLTLSMSLVCAASFAFGQSEEFGAWKTLFNGKDATGWLVAKKRGGRAIGDAPAGWSVVDGALTNGNGRVEDIATREQFDNYELEVEYMIPPRGNSGVYLRGQIEIQIADSHGKPVEKMRGSDAGGIYNKHAPIANPQKEPGKWNAFRIRHLGNRILVWHNGVLVQDNVYKAERTGGAMGEFPAGTKLTLARGPIMLQGDHSKVSYRAIRIRPLCSPAGGWRPIFTGEDLAAFTIPGAKVDEHWSLDDHAVTNKGHHRDMWTKESFGNFLVHYEYKSDPDARDHGNSGFYLRNQWEIQIHRDGGPGKTHGDGALYSLYAPEKAARHGRHNWNHMDVKLDGVKIWVWQNGTLIHDGTVCKTRTDNHGTATPSFSTGPFKFQGDHGIVWFTNIFVKPLPE